MALHCLTASVEWDSPVFKVLPKNETSESEGNQSGFVITQDIRPFFPQLKKPTSALAPTTDRRLIAELFEGNTFLGIADTRYQYQTRAGTRAPEPRLTDGLQPLIHLAKTGDILLIQRSIDRLDLYRLTLVKRTSPEFEGLSGRMGQRRYGLLDSSNPPVSEADLDNAVEESSKQETTPFELIDQSAEHVTNIVTRVARSIVFRARVVELYGRSCAVCGQGLRTPSALVETEAAHVVPRSRMGTDDPRNGLALCRQHHWAFDRGLFGVGEDRKVIVPNTVLSIPQNAVLAELSGRTLREASENSLQVHPDALKWHRDNLLAG